MAADGASGAVAGVAGWKLIGGLAGLGAIGAALASVVVMCMTHPRSAREWAVGLVSTVMASIAGGSAVIQHFGLQSWAHDTFGIMSLLGVAFACGLPGWAIVRWAFNWMSKREGKDLAEVIKEIKA